jgi:MarR family transcriptional regulator, transcriptional regulator for hemolysin
MTSQIGEHLGGQLAETARVWRSRLDERLRPLGLSQTRWLAILHLSKSRDGLPQTELATRLGISHASLSPQIDRLEQDGWVERHSLAGDRRCKTLHLTEQAKALSREIKQTSAKLRRELFEGLSEDDIRACERVLAHILQRAQNL